MTRPINPATADLDQLLRIQAGFDDFEIESACEIIAQYKSETAQFGDAGPGQGIQAAECRRFLAWVDQVHTAIRAFPIYGPPTPITEEPF